MSQVEFGAHVSIEDRDPAVLVNNGWTHRGKSFRATSYIANPKTTEWDAEGRHHAPVQGWRWYRSGPILKDDGTPRKDNATGSVLIGLDDVPGYALRALVRRIERSAEVARDGIDKWVQAARALLIEDVGREEVAID